ncbi:MAG TPA: CCA tRNA nucleotidyltransferase [Candidatus Sulfotelmatobacter sp.]|jgi:poly(A) polymerase|nr:CCA tRNA nucleotidyltransferase [Candidatus Sulfotelmatobacter sp.]
MLKNFSTSVIRKLRERGFQAYLVGGCVRDLLLGREPKDYDVATNAVPRQVMEIFPETYAVGVQFGVVLVPVPKGDVESNVTMKGASKSDYVEVATFRADIGYSDGRHPDEVRFSSDPREDVARRDFTINGMMLDPVTGEVLDFVGGRGDLKAGIIRAIGDPEHRFAEDKLRMLRAVRFAARFEYEIEPATFTAIQKLARGIEVVSRERVRDELTRMLTEGHARRAFLLLDESGLLMHVLPEISAMHGVQQPPEFHPEGDVFVHTLMVLENLPQPCPTTLAWGALLHDVGKPATFRRAPDRIRFDNHVEVGVKIAEQICWRMRFSNDETEQILALVDNHMRFGHVSRMKESTLKRFLRLAKFDEHLALHRADSLASHRNLATYEFIRRKREEIPVETIHPKPLVTGDDLIAAGHRPGPKFREMLSAVEDAQLEGKLPSRDAALEFVRREFPA